MRHAFRVVGRIVAGLIAVTVLAGLLLGLPWLLIAWIGWPLPHHIPTVDQITTALTSPIDDQTLLDILAVLAWLLWANFVRDVIAEILDTISDIADARRDPTRLRPHRSSGGPMRIAATVLVGAITAAILLDSARALTARTSTSAAVPQGRPAATASATHTTGPTVPIGPPVTVTRASTVIRAAGTATAIPTAVTVDQTTPATPQIPAWARNAPGGTYQVRPGDDLWDIAEQRLGDPNRWREIYVASRYRPQPDGDQLTDPDLIRPGWILALPAPTAPTNQPPAASPPAPPTHHSAAAPPAATGTPSPDESSSPTEPDVTKPDVTKPGAANHGGTAHGDTAHAEPAHHPGGVNLPSGAWVGFGLAAAITTAVAALRLHRRRTARLRWPIPLTAAAPPPQPPIAVMAAATAARPLGTRLHTNSPGLIPNPPDTPTATGLTADGEEISLHDLAHHGIALTGPGAQPVLRAAIAAALSHGLLDEPDERPSLITTTTLLTDLLPHDTAAVGLDPQQRALDGERLHLADTTGAAVTRFEQEMLYRRRILDGAGATSVRDLDPDDERLPLCVLVVPADPAYAVRVAAVRHQAIDLNLGIVALGATADLTMCAVAADGTAQAEAVLDEGARLATLSDTDLAAVLDLLRDATTATESDDLPAHDDWPAHDDEADVSNETDVETPPPPAPASTPPVWLTLLGTPTLHTTNRPLTTGVRGDSYALLAQLAVHPAGRTLEQLVAALHPGVEPKPAKQRTHTAVTSLRRVLRDATHLEDQQFLINENNHYRIDPAGIDVDLWRMLTAIHQANHAATDADTLTALQHAADTYGGDFASGIDHLWATEHATTYRHHILDLLARIAELHETDQPDAALAALHQALDHDPLNEELYQRIMRIQGRLGRPDAVRRTLQLCEARLADIQAEPSPATRRVAARQLRPPAA